VERKENVMSKNNKNKKKNINDLAKTVRGSWNGVNPVTRVVESKKNKPPKYKHKITEDGQ
jgi:hypothetical protein